MFNQTKIATVIEIIDASVMKRSMCNNGILPYKSWIPLSLRSNSLTLIGSP